MANLKRRDKSKVQKKAKSGATPREPVAPRSLWRRIGLLTILACLLVAFLWTGGATGFANSMANSAITAKRLEAGEWWLGFSKFFSSNDAYSDFLQARIDRKRGDYDTMMEHLKSALKKGFPPVRLDREQTIAAATPMD